MIKRYISIFIVLFLTNIIVVHAADDPMKSLFLFQKQMADKGNSSAMMKLGEMYERGEGVAQSNENALKMYEKAKSAKHKGADAAIQRVKDASNKSALNAQREAQKKEQAQKQREELARQKAEEKRQQEQQAAKEKAAKEKLAKEKAAKERAERQRLAKTKADKLRAEQNKIKAEKAAAAKASAAKAAAEAKAKQIRILAEQKRRQEQAANPEKESNEGFVSDPCKSPAARLLSICKKK